MKKTILQESDAGIIYRYDKIPNTMFNFYILKRREFKDGTFQYNLCAELNNGLANKYIVIETMRGTKKDAIKRLDEIIKNS